MKGNEVFTIDNIKKNIQFDSVTRETDSVDGRVRLFLWVRRKDLTWKVLLYAVDFSFKDSEINDQGIENLLSDTVTKAVTTIRDCILENFKKEYLKLSGEEEEYLYDPLEVEFGIIRPDCR